jgi:hypothetical protein
MVLILVLVAVPVLLPAVVVVIVVVIPVGAAVVLRRRTVLAPREGAGGRRAQRGRHDEGNDREPAEEAHAKHAAPPSRIRRVRHENVPPPVLGLPANAAAMAQPDGRKSGLVFPHPKVPTEGSTEVLPITAPDRT